MEACPRCYTSNLKNHWKQEPVFHKHSPQRANLHRSRSACRGECRNNNMQLMLISQAVCVQVWSVTPSTNASLSERLLLWFSTDLLR
ncbi:hypothetical protein PVAP13_6NG203309 [Panicum virgatum]|uniref:Uncharacterized protein n=1 Tax=Panicum virgatum TaxID=38727 RepID=A0A8T0QZB6_PANVG|nr:hypothetical protein PVAP13_6NG203309 [Panicum virgatum]